MKNLIIERIETPNRRLWVLRESMHLEEANFAAFFDLTVDEYHQYEKVDSPIPNEFFECVADKLSMPIEWLRCECPLLPIPTPKHQK